MRGQTLGKILNLYRAEVRVSLNAAHNTQAREQQVILIQRTQERLWQEYDWPHLIVYRNYPAVAGQRFYDFSGDFDLERIDGIAFKTDQLWLPLLPTLTEADYLIWDSELDKRSWPVRKWRVYENEQVEVWPLADKAGDPTTLEGYFKVHGVRRLSPFVADSDRADLDDRLLALYAAAETLAASGAKDAGLKLDAAKSLHAKLQGRLTKRRRFQMLGTERKPFIRRPFVPTYRPPGA